MSILDTIGRAVKSVFPPAKVAADIVGLVAGAFGKDREDPELLKLQPAIQQLVIERDTARDHEANETMRVELESRARMVEAEMAQGDKFTKRARPGVVYGGMILYVVEFGVRAYLLLTSGEMPSETIVPVPMVAAHTTAMSIWFYSRGKEKQAAVQGTEPSKWVKMITGS